MFLIDKIIPTYFFLALFIGFLMTYMFTPPPEIIYRYPTPENVNSSTYKDKGNHCFKYKANEVKCPSDNNNISKVPH